VTFKPVAVTTYGGNIVVNSNRTAGQNTVAVTGTGQGSIINLGGNMIYGDSPIGVPKTSVLNIKNTGNSALSVSSISYPAGFSGAFSGSIAAGASKAVTVTFNPTTAKTYGGNIVVNSNRSAGRNYIAASGTGLGSIISVTGNIAFGTCPINTTRTLMLAVKNTGNLTLTVSNISYPEGFSGIYSGTLAPGASKAVTVTFRPTSKKDYGGNIVVMSNRSAGRNYVSASGTGI
jgi:archaellum component FlaG (FlaF/FlaG flagellin family)